MDTVSIRPAGPAGGLAHDQSRWSPKATECRRFVGGHIGKWAEITSNVRLLERFGAWTLLAECACKQGSSVPKIGFESDSNPHKQGEVAGMKDLAHAYGQ